MIMCILRDFEFKRNWIQSIHPTNQSTVCTHAWEFIINFQHIKRKKNQNLIVESIKLFYYINIKGAFIIGTHAISFCR